MSEFLRPPIELNNNIDNEKDRRQEVINDWLKSAQFIAHFSELQDVEENLNYLSHPNLVIPDNQALHIFYNNDQKDTPAIMPIFPEDIYHLHPQSSAYSIARGYSYELTDYIREENIIIVGALNTNHIYTEEVSCLTKGIALHSEINHARITYEENFIYHDEIDSWIEEAEVAIKEYEIFSKLGGNEYQTILYDILDNILRQTMNNNDPLIILRTINHKDIQNLWSDVANQFIYHQEVHYLKEKAYQHALYEFYNEYMEDPLHQLAIYLQNRNKITTQIFNVPNN